MEVHEALHRRRQRGEVGDPIEPLAAELIERAWLLCFDEFQVTNIADAMLLGRLFGQLFERGLVMVATSNLPPDELYAGGLQRELFLPFIALLQERLDILELDGTIDHRRARLAGMTVYHTPTGAAAERALAAAFARLTDGASGAPDTLTVQGRRLSSFPGRRAASPGSSSPVSASGRWVPPTISPSPRTITASSWRTCRACPPPPRPLPPPPPSLLPPSPPPTPLPRKTPRPPPPPFPPAARVPAHPPPPPPRAGPRCRPPFFRPPQFPLFFFFLFFPHFFFGFKEKDKTVCVRA